MNGGQKQNDDDDDNNKGDFDVTLKGGFLYHPSSTQGGTPEGFAKNSHTHAHTHARACTHTDHTHTHRQHTHTHTHTHQNTTHTHTHTRTQHTHTPVHNTHTHTQIYRQTGLWKKTVQKLLSNRRVFRVVFKKRKTNLSVGAFEARCSKQRGHHKKNVLLPK